MHDQPPKIKVSKTCPHTVVFITGEVWPKWPAGDWQNLEAFLDDMDALGFAIWRTPGTIFVFTGEVA